MVVSTPKCTPLWPAHLAHLPSVFAQAHWIRNWVSRSTSGDRYARLYIHRPHPMRMAVAHPQPIQREGASPSIGGAWGKRGVMERLIVVLRTPMAPAGCAIASAGTDQQRAKEALRGSPCQSAPRHWYTRHCSSLPQRRRRRPRCWCS